MHRSMTTIAAAGIMLVSGATLAETHVIEAYSTSFVPTTVDAAPGDTIQWVYVTGYPHSVTSGSDCIHDGFYFDEYPLDVFEWVVPEDAPAEIPFFCDPHCDYDMEGVINVMAPADPGRLTFGIMDLADVNCEFGTDSDGTSGLAIESNDGHFAIGCEIEDGDVELVLEINKGTVYITDADGTDDYSTNTVVTVEEGTRFAIHGDDGVAFTLGWQDDIDDDEANFIALDCDDCSISANGDMTSFRTADMATMTFQGEGDIPMSVVGNVTSTTLTLPAFGEEGLVTIPAGEHDIVLNASAAGDIAWVLLEMEGGDDGGGGDEGCAEDINDDGVVGVDDLLAIIGAWGNTCP